MNSPQPNITTGTKGTLKFESLPPWWGYKGQKVSKINSVPFFSLSKWCSGMSKGSEDDSKNFLV